MSLGVRTCLSTGKPTATRDGLRDQLGAFQAAQARDAAQEVRTGAVVGLVSEHDLISKDGPTAADVMSPGIVSVTEDAEVDDVRHLLVDRRIRRVPVLSAGQLVGIVSRADIVALIAMEWVCEVCGTQVRGERPPASCPTCAADTVRFVHQPQPPGA